MKTRIFVTILLVIMCQFGLHLLNLTLFPSRAMGVGVRQLVAEAKKKAAEKDKQTIEILADAEAARINKIAAAEAGKIETINSAAEKAQQNPLFLKLRQLDVEEKRIEKWDGQFPNWYMGTGMAGTNPNLLLSVGTGSTDN